MHRRRQRFMARSSYEYSDELQLGNPVPENKRRKLRVRWRACPRPSVTVLRLVLVIIVGSILLLFAAWEPHIELSFYPRSWIKSEILAIEPLAGCFDHSQLSPKYNLTRAQEPKRNEIHAGMSMRLGMDCYDFAGTIRAEPSLSLSPGERINYHSYWRTDLASFGPRQEWMLKSFFSTQDVKHSRLLLWSNGELLERSEVLQRWTRTYPEALEVRVANIPQLAKGTALDGSSLLDLSDTKAWVDGDLVRLLVIWAFGGVWVDMDSLLTRDLAPLLEHEFVIQWDCYDKIYSPLNGAIMHFQQHSPYLCEAFEIMAHSPPPRHGSTDWGSLLYYKLWRRLVAAGVAPFKVLPFCFTDGRSCRLDNRLPDPFNKDPSSWGGGGGGSVAEGGMLDRSLQNVFSVHLHNQWEKAFPRDGWVERLLLRRYDGILKDKIGREL